MGNFRNYIAHKQENDFKVIKRKFNIQSKEIVFKKHREIEDKFSEISTILYGTAFLLEPIELSSLLYQFGLIKWVLIYIFESNFKHKCLKLNENNLNNLFS